MTCRPAVDFRTRRDADVFYRTGSRPVIDVNAELSRRLVSPSYMAAYVATTYATYRTAEAGSPFPAVACLSDLFPRRSR